jgi:hypothetical protein
MSTIELEQPIKTTQEELKEEQPIQEPTNQEEQKIEQSKELTEEQKEVTNQEEQKEVTNQEEPKEEPKEVTNQEEPKEEQKEEQKEVTNQEEPKEVTNQEEEPKEVTEEQPKEVTNQEEPKEEQKEVTNQEEQSKEEQPKEEQTEEQKVEMQKNETTINIPVSKENLDKSAVAVNANILANLVLYQSILEKIKEVSEPSEKSDIESKIDIVNNLIKTSKELLQLVQITLNIPEQQQLDEDIIISKSKGDIDSKFKLFNVAESLGFLGLGLALLGGKNKKKYTKKAFTKIQTQNKNKKRNTKCKRNKKSNTKSKTNK